MMLACFVHQDNFHKWTKHFFNFEA